MPTIQFFRGKPAFDPMGVLGSLSAVEQSFSSTRIVLVDGSQDATLVYTGSNFQRTTSGLFGTVAGITLTVGSQSLFAISGMNYPVSYLDENLFNREAWTVTGSHENDAFDTGQYADNFSMGAGDDFANGMGGDDSIIGGAGHDILLGNFGNDTIRGGAGDDVLDGGDGDDLADYANEALEGGTLGIEANLTTGTVVDRFGDTDTLVSIERIRATDVNDTITGTSIADHLQGLGGNDTLFGLSADDFLEGGDGDDMLSGGAGADVLDGGDGADTASFMGGNGVTVSLLLDSAKFGDAHGDTLISIENLSGSAFFDELTGDAGSNVLSGEGGNDYLNASNGDDDLFGGDSNDTLFGGAGADDIDGGNGTDTVNYSNSNAAIQINLATSVHTGGHAAGDTLTGVETVTGSAFADTFTGGSNAETFNGGKGDDLSIGSLGADRLNGNQDVDTVDYSGSGAAINVNLSSGVGSGAGSFAEGDLVYTVENIIGTGFADKLTGSTAANVLRGGNGADEFNASLGNDQIFGEGGDDLMVGGAGADKFDGGSGTDWVYYSNSDAGVNANMLTATAAGGHAAGDTFTAVENLHGSSFGDILGGNNSDNTLNGFQGSDTLFGYNGADVLLGGAGDDWLNGAEGDDTLSGYLGVDTFIYNTAAFGQDTIVGFENGVDRIDLSAGLTFASFTETAFGPNGTRLTLTADPDNVILILGATPGQIDASDFV